MPDIKLDGPRVCANCKSFRTFDDRDADWQDFFCAMRLELVEVRPTATGCDAAEYDIDSKYSFWEPRLDS